MEEKKKGKVGVARQTLEQALSAYEGQVLNDGELYHSESQEHLKGYEDVLAVLADRGRKHNEYRHYATRSRIADILRGRALYLNDGSSWNDRFDRERFNPSFMGTKRFGACFSATSVESIAMWMLYGGVDGNGAMINFDRKTLLEAMGRDKYECGRFNDEGEFECLMTLPAEKLHIELVDVLYFEDKPDGSVSIGRPSRKEKSQTLKREAFNGIGQIAKHQSWSYENEVRLVATIDKLDLRGHASRVTCVKLPICVDAIEDRVFDSPVSDGRGGYLDSELCGTVDWDLCSSCRRVGSLVEENR